MLESALELKAREVWVVGHDPSTRSVVKVWDLLVVWAKLRLMGVPAVGGWMAQQ